MDVAYDHIQEENFPEAETSKRKQTTAAQDGEDGGAKQEPGINQEFAEAYKAFSASPWGVKLGGFWASAKKQVRASLLLEGGGRRRQRGRWGWADECVCLFLRIGRTILRHCNA
jgi:hypothetical protein